LLVNFLEYWQIKKGKEVIFSWITDIELTKETVFKVMQGGRARWKIENETFNTLKNQGYNLEHNYGHGEKNLSSVFGCLTFMAFLIDQLQAWGCELFKSARQSRRTLISLWHRMIELFTSYLIPSDRHVVDLCSFVWCFFVPGLLLSVIVNINFISVKKVGSITSAKT
jgi:hypothetical protein